MIKRRRLLVMTMTTLTVCFIVGVHLGQGKNPASAAPTSWNPAVNCVPVVTTIENIVGTQTNSNGGATQAGGWYGGQSIPSKTDLNPPCTVNGAPMFVELHDVNVEGMTCNSFTGGNDGDCWGNVWDNSSGQMTLLNQIHTEIAGTWITAGTAPAVPATNTQIDMQGFVYWDSGHLSDSWHSFSGWEIHPVSAWRATSTNDFSMSVSPSSGAVAAGSSTTATVSTTLTGGTSQQLTLAATGLPSGATASFNPPTVSTGGSSVVTINAGSSTPIGNYNLSIIASGSSATHSAAYALTVNGAAGTGITNGGFETGNLSGWTPSGKASVTTSAPHSGTYAAMVGLTTATKGDSSVAQSFMASTGGTLSFWYSITCNDTVSYDWGTATLTDNTSGTVATPLPPTCPSNSTWKQVSATLTAGHYYTLALINHDDNSPGDPTYTKYDDVAIQAPAGLPAPTGVTATATSQTAVNVSWTSVSGATGYTLQRSPDGSTGWTTIGSPTGTNYTDSGLSAATTYYYRVSATGGGNTSPYSTVASATTQPNPPPAPGSLTATAANSGEIDLSWGSSSGATGYRVERSNSPTTGFSTLTTVSAPSSSYADQSVGAGSTWYYRVFATNGGGSSGASPVASATTPPATPTGLAASTASAGEIDLSWATSAGATGYTVQRSPDGSSGWATIGTPSTTGYSDTGLNSASPYYYRVSASTGSTSSPYSTTVSATTTPSAPTGLTAAATAPNAISLQWNDVTGETSFTVQRSPDGTSWASIATVGANVTNYTDTGLAAGSTYYYRVLAIDAGGSSAPSASASATAVGAPPAQPSGVSATTASASEIDIQWQGASDASGYRVERSADGSTGWTAVYTGGATPTSYSDLGLGASTTYYYRVIATNSSGPSPASAVVSATTKPLPPATPANPAASALSASQISVTWSGGETGFTVQRSPNGTDSWTTAGTTAQGVTSFTDTGLAGATTYYYRVLATNSGGSSAPSTVVSATTPSGAPAAPTGLRAAALSPSSVSLDWGAATGATSYQVQRSPDGSTGWTTLGTVGTAGYTDTGLTAATTYWYRVIAVNTSGNSAPSGSVSVTTFVVSCPCSAWPASTVPTVPATGDTSANELGVKFRVDVSGTITGLRFYKGTTNTGTHTAHLWSRTGTLLATATFSNESASGWQQVTFSSPVAVTAGTTYVASYFAPSGHYAADQNYFATQGVDNGPVHLLANGVDGADGVYKQTSSGFPTLTYRSSNYWVDVVFNANAPATPTSVTASAAPAAQITLNWAAVTGATSYSVAYSSDGVSGWVVVGSTTNASWVDVRPVPGVANYYRVSAVSVGGASTPSSVVSAVPSG